MNVKDQKTESLESTDERCVVSQMIFVFFLCLNLLKLTNLSKDAEIKIYCHLA